MKRQDALDKIKNFTSYNPEHCKHLDRFVSSLGIPDFQFYVGRTSKQLECRSLTGLEKLKLISRITVVDMLPSVPHVKCHKIQ